MAATTPAKLLARMQRLAEEQVQKDFIGMLYGPPGGGKTTLAVALAQQLADGGEVLYLDSSDGWVSLENIEGLTDGVIRLQFETLADVIGLAQAIKKRATGFENIRVVVIDELSSIAEDVLMAVAREAAGVANGEIVEDVGGDHGRNHNPTSQMVLTALDGLHDIPDLHVIVVAHDREKTDHRKVTDHFPAFAPLLRTSIAKRMHVIAYVSASVKGAGNNLRYEREVQSQPTALISAKSRIGDMPLKTDFNDWLGRVVEWVEGDTMAHDITAPEPTPDIEPDELPTEGAEIGDFETEDDEADAVVALN